MTPEDFARLFAGAFGRQDASSLAAMLADDADVVTLTGAVAEGAKAAEAAFAAEFAGIFAAARLVTGKQRLRTLGPGAVILTQRFVVSGARDAQGQEMPRFAAVSSVVMIARSAHGSESRPEKLPDTWQVVTLGFSAISQ